MKKILMFMLSVCLCLTQVQFVSVQAATTEIYSKEDLNNIRHSPNGTYILMNDIIFEESDFFEGGAFYNNGKGWTPISGFSGTFDGNGHVISGLTIKDSMLKYTGLFGQLSGTIKNLGLTNVRYSITYTGQSGASYSFDDGVGGIAGYSSGTIDNCYVTGSIDANVDSTGGLVGFNHGTIKNSHNEASVIVDSTIFQIYGGGIAGMNNRTITNSYNLGYVEVTAPQHYTYGGGITGSNESASSSITNCYNKGTIWADNYGAGLAGFSRGRVTYSFNAGNVSAEEWGGGLVGYNYGGRIMYCYNSGNLSTTLQGIGGIASRNYEGGLIENCYNTGTIHGKGPGVTNCYAGGITTSQGENCTIRNCYSIGRILLDYSTAQCYGGTIISYLYGGTIENCHGFDPAGKYGYYSAKRDGTTIKNCTTMAYSALKTQSTYSGFDFNNVWSLDPNSDIYTFPTFKNLTLLDTDYTISFKPHALYMNVGQTATLEVDFGMEFPHAPWIYFQTSNSNVLAVDQNGLMTARTNGTATITATSANNQVVSTTITVKAKASTDPTIYFATTSSNVYQGQTVKVNIVLGNSPAIDDLHFTLVYDEAIFDLLRIEDKGVLGTAHHSGVNLSWSSNAAIQPISGTVIATAVLKVKDDAPSQVAIFTIENHYDNDVFYYVTSKGVTSRAFIYGDVDSSGVVNAQDRLILSRYLAHWKNYSDEMVNFLASDVNADGDINALDRAILARKIANWSGYTTLPKKI